MRWAVIAILAQIGFGQQLSLGTLLVATRKSHDADLKESVVLIVHYSPEGVIGLIVNHPVDGSVYFGGPLPIGVRTLVKSAAKPENSEPILKGVYMAPRKLPDAKNARVFAGYVGWTPQQVKDEISLGLWTVRTADAATVFDAHPDTLWRRLAR